MSREVICCGISGCQDNATEKTPCCCENVCDRHSHVYYCSGKNCCTYYCQWCAEINGYVCTTCNEFYCDSHNTDECSCMQHRKNDK